MVKKSPKLLKKHDTAFQVEWKDGHVSWYPYTYLRQMCPCAECSIIRHKGRDVHSLFAPQGDGDATLIEVSDDIQPLDVQLVGRYALQFSWNDGHDTGSIRLKSYVKRVRVQNAHPFMKSRLFKLRKTPKQCRQHLHFLKFHRKN